MNKTRFQKVSRAAVASVLAASGTVAVLPINNVKAESPFTDLDPSHFAYDAIINLYERNIISGYGNGKFGPNDSVTRGQAAKMLAQVLELNTESVVNPNFKDVNRTDPFYKYIAALANAGVINGFVDQTYRPNEPITRGQMATILTRGFQFKPSTVLNHPFDDVSEQAFERYFIQTIYDLGITNGKGKHAFAPYGSVTRGELAVFINRAENVEASPNPSYEVTDVYEENNITYAYINGIKHTVDTKLKSIFNEENAEALEGAIITGEISDTKRILDLASITFTASGTKARPLQFNGNNKMFTGNVSITGSYIKFRDWVVTGDVTIEEKTESLAHVKRSNTALPTIASIGQFSFIDWGTETDPDDDFGYPGGTTNPDGPADGSEDGTGLVPPPSEDVKGYSSKMSPVNRHIEFLDCDIRYLIIKVAGTHITANNVLPNVTIADKVKTVELYAQIETLYMQADTNTTVYGVSKIETMYKNSVKSVTLDADTTIDLLVVDNSNGWIDLGEYTYIHKVIIPPDKMPNDIFNDFINDNDLIGDIEDPSGEDVDRDPIENTIVPDLEEPVLTIADVEVDGTTAKATFQSNEDGEIYYLVRKKNDDIPSIKTIIESQSTKWGGKIRADEMKDVIAEIKDLDDESEYILYAVSMDEAGNISDKVEREFRVVDATAPLVNITKAEAIGGKNSAEIEFKINEKGAIHYLLRLADEEPPTVADVKRLGKTIVVDDFSQTYRVREIGLEEYTDYVVYAIGEDGLKNLSPSVVSSSFTTGEADYERPYLLNPQLDQYTDVENWDGEGRTQVTLQFSEPLDEETAQDVKNYVLSGTGNLTGNPYKAELSRDGTEVVLTIPSMAAFVDNDTLVITIDKVTDLAGNEIAPKSQAVLEFTVDRAVPVISNIQVSRPKPVTGNSNLETKDVTFTANVPGRYYYLILPIEDGLEEVKVEDVIFPEQYLKRNSSIIKYSLPDKGNVGGIIQAPGENILPNVQYDLLKATVHEKGYKIYMVMQNRDGKYSEKVSEAIFIDDMQFPKVTGHTFIESIADPNVVPSSTMDLAKIETQLTTPASADTTFRFDVDANGEYLGEKYFRYAIRFSEKMNQRAVETVTNYVLAGSAGSKLKVAKATLMPDGKTVLLDLQAIGETEFEEYNLIHGEKLQILLTRNIIDSSGLGVGGSYDANGLPTYSSTPTPVNANGFTYVDQVKPKLKETRGKLILNGRVGNVIETIIDPTLSTSDLANIKYSFDGTLKVEFTFTENIESTNIPTLTLDPALTATTSSDVAVINTVVNGNKVTYELRTRNIPDLQGFHFNFSNTIKDAQNNIITTGDVASFNGFYRFRAMPLEITGIQLVNPSFIDNGPNDWTNYSTQFEVTGLMKYYASNMEDEIRLYYAVSVQELNADQIINPQNYQFSTVYDNALVQDITFRQEFSTVASRPFQNGQVIWFVLTDGYGNVSVVNRRQIPKLQTRP